jgi:hypothetical protein
MHKIILKYIVAEFALYVLFKTIADNFIKPHYMECKRVRVKERKLTAKWTLEPQQTIVMVQGPEVEEEMMRIIKEEMHAEMEIGGYTSDV